MPCNGLNATSCRIEANGSIFTFFISSSFGMMPREALLSRHRLRYLPPFYHILFQVWRTLDGGLAPDGGFSVLALTDAPLPLDLISPHNIYAFLRSRASTPPHCMEKFLPTYCPLHWPQTRPLSISTGRLRTGFSTRVLGWHTVSA